MMTAEQVWKMTTPQRTDCFERLKARILARGKCDERDTRTIFYPYLRTVTNLIGGDPLHLVAQRLADWQPEDINEQSLRVFISRLEEAVTPPAPTIDIEAMRARMSEIQRSLN